MKNLINEAKRMQQLAGILTESQLNEVGMNIPMIAKEPESWGGKPDKESKWFVHGDYETVKTKTETPIEFIDFEDNRPDYDSVLVGTNMPSERSQNAAFNKGKVTIAAKIDDAGVPTGLYWIVGMDSSTSDSIIKKVKDWTPLNNYIKDQLSKKQQPQSESQLNEIEAKDVKVGGTYIASMPTSNDGKERVDVKVKVIAPSKGLSDEHFVIEFLEDKDYINPVSKGQNRYEKGKQNNIEAKYLKPAGANESLDIESIVNEALKAVRKK